MIRHRHIFNDTTYNYIIKNYINESIIHISLIK